MAKSLLRLQARELRKEGESIGSIASQLGVSKSSVSLWCSDIELSSKQIEKLIKREGDGAAKGRQIAAKLKKEERESRMRAYVKVGKEKIGKLSDRELLLVGVALYWAEGNKKQRRVVFANSDPMMVKFFIKWLEVCLNVTKDKLFPFVGINQAHQYRIKIIEKYWSNLTGISIENFTRASFKKVKAAKIYEKPDEYFGTFFVRVEKSTNMNYEILGYIKALGLAA